MCQFITLVAPSNDRAAVAAVMARHGRAARLIDNPSVSQALEPGEHQYLTTASHCDCGTSLARRSAQEDLDAALAKNAVKWARKGWSKSKIARAMDDHRKTAARPAKEGPDSHALWATIVDDLLTSLKLPRAGLLVHLYAGNVGDEAFTVTSRNAVDVSLASLETMQEDEVLFFAAK